MYLKLKQFNYDDEGIDGGDCDIVPRKFDVIEAKRIAYNRVKCNGWEDLVKKQEKYFSRGSYHFPFTVTEDKEEFEAFFIDVYEKGDELSYSIIAINCTLYIMNENGKTIDSDSCREF